MMWARESLRLGALEKCHRLEPDIVLGLADGAKYALIVHLRVKRAGRIDDPADAAREESERRLGNVVDLHAPGQIRRGPAVRRESNLVSAVTMNMLRLGAGGAHEPLDQVGRIERIVIHCYDGTVGEVAKCVDALGVRAYVGNEADLQPLAPLAPERERYVGERERVRDP